MTEAQSHPLDDHLPWRAAGAVSCETALAVAGAAFVEHLNRAGTSGNTVAAFAADLRLLCWVVGGDVSVGEVTGEHIAAFYARFQDSASATRSLRRRITTIQAFFRHLSLTEVLPQPAEAPAPRPQPARPEPVLSEEEVAALEAAACRMHAEGDQRPLLLVSLLLATGMTKAECLALRLSDFDLEHGTVTVSRGPARRVLALPDEAKQAVQSYAGKHPPAASLFRCTGRNLEYILGRVGAQAGLERNPSFRLLRATAIARRYHAGEDVAGLIGDLGISRHTWPALRRRIGPARR